MFTPPTISILDNGQIVPGVYKYGDCLVTDNNLVGCRLEMHQSPNRIFICLPFGGYIHLSVDEFNELQPYLSMHDGIILTPLRVSFKSDTHQPVINMHRARYDLVRGHTYMTKHDSESLEYHGEYYIAVLAGHTDSSRSYLRIVYPKRPFHIFSTSECEVGDNLVAMRKITPVGKGVLEYAHRTPEELLRQVYDMPHHLSNGVCHIRGIHRKLYGASNLVIGISDIPLDETNYPIDLPRKVINWYNIADNQVEIKVACRNMGVDVVVYHPTLSQKWSSWNV